MNEFTEFIVIMIVFTFIMWKLTGTAFDAVKAMDGPRRKYFVLAACVIYVCVLLLIYVVTIGAAI